MAAVLFSLVLVGMQTIEGQAITSAEVMRVLLFTVGGGILVGVVCASVAIAVAGAHFRPSCRKHVNDSVAYGSFMVAGHFHFSGVLATVAAGLMAGNTGGIGR